MNYEILINAFLQCLIRNVTWVLARARHFQHFYANVAFLTMARYSGCRELLVNNIPTVFPLASVP